MNDTLNATPINPSPVAISPSADFRYPHRVAALRARMAQSAENNPAVSALVVTHLENIAYLTGFTGSNALLFLTQSEAVFLTDGRYAIQSATEVPGFERVILPQGTEMAKAAAEQITKRHLPNAGFEAAHLSVKAFDILRAAVDGENGAGKSVALVPKSGMVEAVRAVKDADEIARLRAAVALGDRGFDYLRGLAKPGMTEKQLAWQLEIFLRESGATRLSFDSIVGSGANSALIHGRPSNRVIGSSGAAEFLLLDFGAELDGYCSDLTRTVVIGGEPTARHRAVYDSVVRAQAAAIATIRPGVAGKDVHKAAVESFKRDGMEEHFGHGTGHQLGRIVHDGQAFGVTSEVTLEENMIVTIEPGLYIEGFGGVRIEDVGRITADGVEILTHSPRELLVL